jgi:hypothetical protein
MARAFSIDVPERTSWSTADCQRLTLSTVHTRPLGRFAAGNFISAAGFTVMSPWRTASDRATRSVARMRSIDAGPTGRVAFPLRHRRLWSSSIPKTSAT